MKAHLLGPGPDSVLPPLDTPILIYSPGNKLWRVGEVSAVPEYDREDGSWPYEVYVRGHCTTCDYSHWVPLPDAPE